MVHGGCSMSTHHMMALFYIPTGCHLYTKYCLRINQNSRYCKIYTALEVSGCAKGPCLAYGKIPEWVQPGAIQYRQDTSFELHMVYHGLSLGFLRSCLARIFHRIQEMDDWKEIARERYAGTAEYHPNLPRVVWRGMRGR